MLGKPADRDSDRNLGILTKAISKQRGKCPVQGDMCGAVWSEVKGVGQTSVFAGGWGDPVNEGK